MPRLKPILNNDLFEKSTMSFGAHLEELRRVLMKASLWLALGTAIGVFFANDVVKYVSAPIQDELKQLQIKKFSDAFREVNQCEPSDSFVAWMARHGMIPERVLVFDTDELSSIDFGESVDDAKLGEQLMRAMATNSRPALKPQIQMRSINTKLKSFELVEGFMVYFKASLLVGALISSPAVFWHLWSFIAAGMYVHERRSFYMFLPISLSLFIAGVGIAFFVVLRLVISVLMATSDSLGVDFEPRLSDSLSYVLLVPLGFGIAFQLPLVMLALNRFGVIPIQMYVDNWRTAVLGIAFISMLLTPPEATTMMAMFVPLTILYFLGIMLCRVMPTGYGLGSAKEPVSI